MNRIIGVVKVVLREAYIREVIPRNPADGVGNMKEKPQPPGTFTVQELRMLFTDDTVWPSSVYRVMFMTAAFTGMRRGELLALKWRSVDLLSGVVRVDEAIKDDLGHTEGAPKWDKTRATPLPAILIDELEDLHSNSVRIRPDDYVFSHDYGKVSVGQWRRSFQITMLNTGLIRKDDDGILINERRLKPHSFRHTINSILRAEGVPDAVLRATFGWSSEKVQNGYTQIGPDLARSQTERIDGLFGGKHDL